MLWERSLVMYDVETESYWSHILGEAMAGPLQGKKLEHVASIMTDWQTWLRHHPTTSVLWMDKTSRHFRTDQLATEKLVLGVELAGSAHAWTYSYLELNNPVSVNLEGFPLFVCIDPESKGARVYERRLGGEVLDLQLRDGRIAHKDSEAAWDPFTGKPIVEGPALKPIPSVPSYRTSWMTFHPETTIVEHPDEAEAQ